MAARRVGAAFLVSAVLLSTPLAAQTVSGDPRTLDERMFYFLEYRTDALLRAAPAAGETRSAEERASDLRARFDRLPDVLNVNLRSFTYYALPPSTLTDSFKEFLQSADKARVDQQIGSTSKAVKTGVAALVGFALETGAASETVDQNVATLRTNAEGLARFLSNQDVFATCPDDDRACNAWSALKNLELSASFNVSDSDATSLTGTPAGAARPVGFTSTLTRHQFSSATARYAVMNPRDLRSKRYQQQWLMWFERNRAALQTEGKALLDRVVEITNVLRDSGEYDQWLARTRAALLPLETANAIPSDPWKKTLQRQLDELLGLMRKADPRFAENFNQLGREYLRYLALRRDLMATLVTDPALTVDYTYAEPLLQPRLHTVRVAWAYSPLATPGVPNPGTITVNAGLDYYNDAQPTGVGLNTSHWKDAQVAVQFDRPLGPAGAVATLSASFYYQYQMNPNTFIVPPSLPIPAAGLTLLSEAGSIAVAQATLTIRMASSGLKIPIGVSWANRTELLPGSKFIGHIGFTFDSSPLLLMNALR